MVKRIKQSLDIWVKAMGRLDDADKSGLTMVDIRVTTTAFDLGSD